MNVHTHICIYLIVYVYITPCVYVYRALWNKISGRYLRIRVDVNKRLIEAIVLRYEHSRSVSTLINSP